MANPLENKQAVDNLIVKIKDHPMCLTFEDQGGGYQVIYPEGEFKVHGVRASAGGGKLKALYRILERMERDWIESYPNVV